MRELRALGLTDDGKSLVLVDMSRGAESERFRVAADERLRAALRSGTPRAVVSQPETRVESALSPREIQSRLRAGATADEVAKAAGIPVGRVQRYEAPILAERARVVSEARNASAPGPHRNTPGRPLGALVDDRLVEESVDPESVEWDAKRRPDGTWLVTLAMEAGTPTRATWSWDPKARRVRAADAGATAALAPMPAPTAGPDSLTAVAEAAGVATAQAPNEGREALAVGDDGRRRTAAAGRSVPGRPNGLVVLAGRGSEADSQPVDETSKTAPASPAARADVALDSDVPGGSRTATATRPDRTRVQAEATDLLLPGTEPVRPSRQERLPADPPAAGTGEPVAEPAAVVTEDEPNRDASAGSKTPGRAWTGRRRSAVPAWDDIMFGARKG